MSQQTKSVNSRIYRAARWLREQQEKAVQAAERAGNDWRAAEAAAEESKR